MELCYANNPKFLSCENCGEKYVGRGNMQTNQELCYQNNPKSLFRKYAKLILSFANTQLGRDYLKHNNFYIPNEKLGLLLPNGYIRLGTIGKDKIEAQMVVTTRACYVPKLYPALQAIDLVSRWITSFDEAKELLAWYLGLRGQPLWAPKVLFSILTVNPNANPETTSVDGHVYRNTPNPGESFAALRDGAGSTADDSGIELLSLIESVATPNWQYIFRTFLLFDTSALTALATITAGVNTMGVYVNTKYSLYSYSTSMCVVNPASNVALASGDYQNFTRTRQATDLVNSALTTGAYNNWTLNTTGDGNISKTAITKFGLINSADMDSLNPAGSGQQDDGLRADSAEGTNKPKLVVTYTLPGGGSFKTLLGVGI